MGQVTYRLASPPFSPSPSFRCGWIRRCLMGGRVRDGAQGGPRRVPAYSLLPNWLVFIPPFPLRAARWARISGGGGRGAEAILSSSPSLVWSRRRRREASQRTRKPTPTTVEASFASPAFPRGSLGDRPRLSRCPPLPTGTTGPDSGPGVSPSIPGPAVGARLAVVPPEGGGRGANVRGPRASKTDVARRRSAPGSQHLGLLPQGLAFGSRPLPSRPSSDSWRPEGIDTQSLRGYRVS